MAKTTLQDFLLDRNLLAVKISSREVGGFFRKALTIPLNTAGLALFADGACALYREGQEVSGKFDLILAKTGEIPIHLSFHDLRSSDGLAVSATAVVVVSIATARVDLFRDLCRSFFNLTGVLSTDDLERRVRPECRRVISDHVAARFAADTGDAPVPPLHAALERFLFDAGVRCEKILDLSIASPEHARRAADDRRRADEDLRSARSLERNDARVKRFTGLLKDQDMQGLLARLPDEKLKGVLYARLMEDDSAPLTADELVSKAKGCGEEVVQVIYKAMENLLSTGARVTPEEIESETADRLFVAAGKEVFEIDPASAETVGSYTFDEQLRSIRTLETTQGPLLAAGGKHGLATMRLGDTSGAHVHYELPGGRSVKGGINSIAASGRWLFATHSEFGIARWPLDRPGDPEILFAEATRPHKTTRAVQALDQRVLFSTGQHVYLAPADAGGPPVKFVSSIESPVTCVAAAARTIFAGTESGSIVCWKADAPDQPVVLARKREPIVNLRLARICGIPHLLYGTRDLAIRARVIGQNLETAYETGGPAVGYLDAASDLICASDADGRSVLVWKATAPARPSARIDLWRRSDRPVLDLWMKKVRARSA